MEASPANPAPEVTPPKSFTTSDIPPIPEGEFCVYGVVHAHAHLADALESLYAETTRVATTEPGILYYCLSRDVKDRNSFHFFERYTGRDAFEEHNRTPACREILGGGYIRDVEAVILEPIRPAAVVSPVTGGGKE